MHDDNACACAVISESAEDNLLAGLNDISQAYRTRSRLHEAIRASCSRGPRSEPLFLDPEARQYPALRAHRSLPPGQAASAIA
jgi:hypothetical protein